MLLLESGTRFHTTKFARDRNDMPSPFAMKLRKYLRTKRLEDVRQLGSDRVVDFKFGSGEGLFHIILELYASGNIVLTDANYEIIALLRSHTFEDGVAVQVSQIYPIGFTSTNAGGVNSQTILQMNDTSFREWAIQRIKDSANSVTSQEGEDNAAATKNQKSAKSKKLTLRQLLVSKESGIAYFGPEIIDHCLLSVGLKSNAKAEDIFMSPVNENSDAVLSTMLEALQQGVRLVELLDVPGNPGYILYNDSPQNNQKNSSTLEKQYWDFVPHLFMQHQDRQYAQFPSFDEAVDNYYCKVLLLTNLSQLTKDRYKLF
jgi:predicted ribosome quality control (RQC) complex YloA/Tae2 family protein